MQFLHSEFASESLLFLTEYIQFIKLVKTNHTLMEIFDDIISNKDGLNIPDDLPLSVIIRDFETNLTEKREIDAFLRTCKCLYAKYICQDADLQININGILRRNIKGLLDNDETNEEEDDAGSTNSNIDTDAHTMKAIDMLECFEKAFKEVDKMMDGSFMRFTKSRLGLSYFRRRVSRRSSLATVGDVMIDVKSRKSL